MVLKYFGRTEEDVPSAVVADEVAIFVDCIEEFLLSSWPEWNSARSEVEVAAGINLEKNQFSCRAATLKSQGEVPAMLMQILAKAEGK